jgi:hypothetical protein
VVKRARNYRLGKWGYRGVRYHEHSDLFQARCCGEETYHEEPEDAARAYDAMAKRHFGDSAILNFPEETDD